MRESRDQQYTSSQTLERLLNEAIIHADISNSFEEHIEIFDTFYADDIEVSSDVTGEAVRGESRVRSLLSYRQASFSRLNSINERIMAEMIAQKKCRVLMPSNIVKIEDKGGLPSVHFAETQYAPEVFDAVLYGLGGMTPVAFLQTAGVQLDLKGEPVTDTAHESSVPKVYIIGDLVGHGHGGGSIISGFNSASQAVRHLLQHYLKQPLLPEMVSLDHLLY